MDNLTCLGLRLHVPFWCSFRDPLTSNLHRTFPVPPPTTLYGLCAAALGLEQDDVSRRHEMRFAIAIEVEGELVETYSTWKKAAEASKGEAEKQARASTRTRGLLTPDEAMWISTPIIRQKLIQPRFIVGILCAPAISQELQSALRHPFHPLCLGESDDAVDIEILGEETPQPSQAMASGAVEGVQAGGALANLPRQFRQTGNKWSLERWLVTVPRAGSPVSAASERWACHSQVWSFEPPIEPPESVTTKASKTRSRIPKAELNVATDESQISLDL
jgi:CRISPR-associated Cas5-like protein